MKRSFSVLLMILLVGSAATAARAAKPSSLKKTEWVTFPVSQGGKGMPVDQWLKENPLKPDEDIRLEEISRGETSSTHLVVIRRREPLHVHAQHDLIAIVLRGEGTLTMGERPLEVRPGAILTIPRGVPHSFLNKSNEPAIAYAVFTPPFDGKDMVPLQEQEPVSAVRKK